MRDGIRDLNLRLDAGDLTILKDPSSHWWTCYPLVPTAIASSRSVMAVASAAVDLLVAWRGGDGFGRREGIIEAGHWFGEASKLNLKRIVGFRWHEAQLPIVSFPVTENDMRPKTEIIDCPGASLGKLHLSDFPIRPCLYNHRHKTTPQVSTG